MARHTKLYDKSPKTERDEEGNLKVKKAEETSNENKESGAAPGEDGSNAEMDPTSQKTKEMHDRHIAEMKDMHGRHEEEHKDMHKRHQKEIKKMHGESGEKEEEKVEDTK